MTESWEDVWGNVSLASASTTLGVALGAALDAAVVFGVAIDFTIQRAFAWCVVTPC